LRPKYGRTVTILTATYDLKKVMNLIDKYDIARSYRSVQVLALVESKDDLDKLRFGNPLINIYIVYPISSAKEGLLAIEGGCIGHVNERPMSIYDVKQQSWLKRDANFECRKSKTGSVTLTGVDVVNTMSSKKDLMGVLEEKLNLKIIWTLVNGFGAVMQKVC
jgi:hypothetical protein